VRVVLLLWLLCHPSPAASQQPPEGGGREHGAEAYDGRAQDTSPVEQVAPDSDDAEATNTPQGRAIKATEDAIVILTRYLVVVGVLQLLVFAFQAEMLRRSVNETQKATSTIRDNAISELRAYITLGKMPFPAVSTWTQGPVKGKIEIHNAGRTPAYEMAIAVKAELAGRDFDPRKVLPFDPESVTGLASRGMLGPGDTVNAPIPEGRLLEQNVSRLQAGTEMIYVYGTIRYRDAFKVERYTNFCRRLVLEGDKAEWRATRYGNDADEPDPE
jgi:hypothetical protein